MTAPEYQVTQQRLLMLGKLVSDLDLDGFRREIGHAQAVGAIIDPTLYREASANLDLIEDLALAAQQMQRAFSKLSDKIKAEVGA